jgi:hypothetical protein
MACRDGRALNTRQRLHARQQRRVEPVDAREVGPALEIDWITAAWQLVLHLQHARRFEAWIDVLQPPKALDQQPGADDEDHGQGEFGHHERRSRETRFASARGAPRVLGVERRLQVGAPPLDKWHEPEHAPDDGRKTEGQRQDAPVDRDEREPRHLGRRQQHERTYSRNGQRDAKRARDRGEQQILNCKLSRKLTDIRPERRTNGDFAPPCRAAREQQIRDVDTRYEQHHPNRGEQHEQRRLRWSKDHASQRFEKHTARLVRWICTFEVGSDGRQFVLRRGQRRAPREPPQHQQWMRVSDELLWIGLLLLGIRHLGCNWF